jgi:hypothetical protein
MQRLDPNTLRMRTNLAQTVPFDWRRHFGGCGSRRGRAASLWGGMGVPFLKRPGGAGDKGFKKICPRFYVAGTHTTNDRSQGYNEKLMLHLSTELRAIWKTQ